MTPTQLIKKEILLKAEKGYEELNIDSDITCDNVDELYEELREKDLQWDCESEFRSGEVDTNIEADYSRHYESKSVAKKIDDQWIGWTYWYGGGKHGYPDTIDWMEYAYFLDCKEYEKTIIQRDFTKRD